MPLNTSNRLLAWSLAAGSTALAIAVNAFVQVYSGLDISSLLMVVAVPVGSMALSFLALSGFVLAARRLQLTTSAADLAFLMVLSLSIVPLIYGYQYALATGGAKQSFLGFVAAEVTGRKYSMHMQGMPENAAPVAAGDAGWFLLMIRVACLLAVARISYSLASPPSRSQWQS